MPLQRRLPKRGFKNIFKIEFAVVNLKDINKIEGVDVITPEILIEKGIVKNIKDGVKILGGGELQKPLTIKADAFSASASAKITAAGGKVEVL